MKRFLLLSLLTLCVSIFALAQGHGTSTSNTASVEGTIWEGTVSAPDSTGKFRNVAYRFEFLPGNRLSYESDGRRYTEATWQQNGRVVRMTMNNGYSTWLGTIEGNRMSGNSANQLGHKWDWAVMRRVYQSYGNPASSTVQLGGWIRYSSTAGRFSILMPVQPKVDSQPVDTAAGKLTNHVFLSIKGTAAFAISYADYPPNNADPQEVLDSVRQGAINGIKGTLVSGSNIMHKGFPGREFQASTADALYTSRIFLVNNRLYQMVVVAPKTALTTAEISKFLTSFDLKTDEQ